MQSTEWTRDRLEGRIRDHLRWSAIVDTGELVAPPLKRLFRHRVAAGVRKVIEATPFAGPVMMKILRGVKAWSRCRFSSLADSGGDRASQQGGVKAWSRRRFSSFGL